VAHGRQFALSRRVASSTWIGSSLTAAALFLLQAGSNLLSPLYALYSGRFGFSPGVLTLIFAVYAFVLIPSLLVFGRASDRLGRRVVIVPGLLLSAVASTVIAAASNVAWLFFARILQGVAMGAASGGATAALIERAPPGRQRDAARTSTVAIVGGAALGPLFAGLLVRYGPEPTLLPFLLHATVTVAVAFALATCPDPPRRLAHRHSSHAPRLQADGRAVFTVAAGAAFVTWAVVGLFLTVVPPYAGLLLGSTNTAVFGLIQFSLLGSAAVAQLAARVRSSSAGIAIGLAMVTSGMLAVVLAWPARSVLLLLLGTLLAGAGQGIAFSASVAAVERVSPIERRAELLSALYVILYIGVGAPIVGVGFLAGASSLLTSIVTFAALIGALAVLLCFRIVRIGRHAWTPSRPGEGHDSVVAGAGAARIACEGQ